MQHSHYPPADHADRVRELAVLCRCGHDRGDHLVDEPHACEAVDRCRRTRDRPEPRVDPCTCRKFRPVHSRKANHQAGILRIGATR